MAARFLVLFLTFTSVLAAPAAERRCRNPKQRRAWHTLSDDEKQAYIDAELCLMSKPATLGLRGARTMFDEFQSCHVSQAEIIHHVGAFLPFHRLLMWAHERKLETECGYEGAQPYWQEQLDAGDLLSSPVMDSRLGFGGNGGGPNYCIKDGPFANYVNRLGPSYQVRDHCIDRNVDNRNSIYAVQENVDYCMEETNFLDMWTCLEGAPHFAGHAGIGREMMNPISSPGDPLFYLHHTWIDKLWWDWQSQGPPSRLYEIGGPNRMARNPDGSLPGGGRFAERPADVPEPRIEGDPGDEVTLGHVLNMFGIVDDMRVADVMDIGGALCYEYIEPED